MTQILKTLSSPHRMETGQQILRFACILDIEKKLLPFLIICLQLPAEPIQLRQDLTLRLIVYSSPLLRRRIEIERNNFFCRRPPSPEHNVETASGVSTAHRYD